MQGQWLDNLGVKTELKGETFALFSKDRPKGVFSIARNAWGADYPHPDNILRVLFKSDSGNNDEGYNNPDFDKLIDQAGASRISIRQSPCTTRPSRSSWTTHRRCSPAGASATTRSVRGSRVSQAPPRTRS